MAVNGIYHACNSYKKSQHGKTLQQKFIAPARKRRTERNRRNERYKGKRSYESALYAQLLYAYSSAVRLVKTTYRPGTGKSARRRRQKLFNARRNFKLRLKAAPRTALLAGNCFRTGKNKSAITVPAKYATVTSESTPLSSPGVSA